MAVIDLAAAKMLRSRSSISISRDTLVREPWVDFDDEGNVVDYGFDEEQEGFADHIDPSKDERIFNIHPSEFAETAIRIPEAGKVSDFTFEGREYLRQIYDTQAQRVLLKCGRQVEKSEVIDSLVSLANGKLIKAGTVKLGDALITMANDGVTTTTGKVVWVSRRYKKPCIEITTRQGHVTKIATTHPIRKWEEWLEAGQLEQYDRLAVLRSGGEFTSTVAPPEERIKLTAYMLGDGGVSQPIYTFTQMPGLVLDELISLVEKVSHIGGIYPKGKALQVHINKTGSKLHEWMLEDGLDGHTSHDKFIPDWVFDLSKDDTALFINRLWATDGHVKQNGRSKYSLEYCSVSKPLIRSLQALLWKFGIPTKIRRNWPNYWKKKKIKKYAFILRIETREGVEAFLEQIACLGKSEYTVVPEVKSNNNRDTYPIEINEFIRKVINSRGEAQRFGKSADKAKSLRTAGLRETLKYPLTRDKLAVYVDFFRLDERYDQGLVDTLEKHLYTDLYWDEVVSIKDIGEQECVDFEVEGTHNFVCDGLVTHNSTTIGNRILCYSALTNNFRSLYVSPSAEQAKVFSNDRLKDVMDSSPLLRAYVPGGMNQAVFFKKFINYSQIRLRYAYLTADRVRGIPADQILIDEIQDILIDNIPVIEQCAFHSSYKLFMYSGTPKSMDNTIEFYWTEFSTQNEWVVPCERHGTPKDSSSWHWNVLGVKNIGKTSLICDRCGGAISAAHPKAKWASMNPIKDSNKDKVTFDGYRIPQIMVPWVDWGEIVEALEQYPRAQFMNEKLGMSYDSGVRPITKVQLQKCCKPEIRILDIESFKELARGRTIYAGIDWGPGESASYTVMSLGGYLGSGNFTTFWVHRFTGQDLEPERQLDLISQILSQLEVRLIGVDYGGGFFQNDKLIRRFGAQKVHKYQYNPRQKAKIYWEPRLGRWMCHRSEVITAVYTALKQRKIDLPCWEDFENPYGSDILNMFTEYNERLRMNEYKKPPGKTDDTFHSLLLMFLVSMLDVPRPDIITPNKETGVPQTFGAAVSEYPREHE